jgi:cell division protease FtsH
LDSIGRRRSSDGESSSSERDNTLNSLLVELDGFSKSNGIFVVSATNRIDVIDTALLRAGRIDKQIRLDLPDYEAREKIIQIYIKGKPYDDTILINDLTEMFQGFTGAQIENVLNEAMLFALRNNREIFNIDDINFIYDKTFAGWTPIPHKFDKNMLERIAVHEMGHAIVGYLSQYHSKLNKVVINLSSPNSPGYTLFIPDTNSVQLKESLFEHLMILLAGRIAEEEIFGVSITTGASNDLFEVHKLAVKMIENYGMGTHIIYPLNSEKYKILKDNDIINLIEYAEQISRELIISCRELILYTSKLLVEKKIIKYDELESIIKKNYNKINMIKESENKLRSYNKITKLNHMIDKKFYLDE